MIASRKTTYEQTYWIVTQSGGGLCSRRCRLCFRTDNEITSLDADNPYVNAICLNRSPIQRKPVAVIAD